MIPPSLVQPESKIGEQTRPAGLAEESRSAEASVKTTLDNNQPWHKDTLKKGKKSSVSASC